MAKYTFKYFLLKDLPFLSPLHKHFRGQLFYIYSTSSSKKRKRWARFSFPLTCLSLFSSRTLFYSLNTSNILLKQPLYPFYFPLPHCLPPIFIFQLSVRKEDLTHSGAILFVNVCGSTYPFTFSSRASKFFTF
uniref:Uncharacterized protein n=1 Tax=Meloidogyne enterolobii TaxID=390850 RepID=A0A6V7W0I3_MELEN|nr:unnamed protein product [Meloidogyne enterolobii]